MCFLSDNIYDYYNVSQGKVTVPNMDDGEEFQLADVSGRQTKHTLPQKPTQANCTSPTDTHIHTHRHTYRHFPYIYMHPISVMSERQGTHEPMSYAKHTETNKYILSVLWLSFLPCFFSVTQVPFQNPIPKMELIENKNDGMANVATLARKSILRIGL